MSDDHGPAAVRAADDVLVQELPDGEVILLHLKREEYFGLDAVGRSMWRALTRTGSVDAAHSELAREFPDVETSILRADLEELVGKLADRDLLEVRA